MYYFTCADQFEDKMCCIYAAWEKALTAGHDNVELLVEPVGQQTFFDEYIHVEHEEKKYQSVISTIVRKTSRNVLYQIQYVSLSCEKDALDAIYRFLRKAFQIGPDVLKHFGEPEVMRFFELRRNVGNEAHYFREFARFTHMEGDVFVCHLEPKSNVITIVGNHFADRMPSEHFMIIDDNRMLAVVHPKNGENYLRILSGEEMELLRKTESKEDEYTELWRLFVKTIAIQERENKNCQRNMMRLWMRKHATEFL